MEKPETRGCGFWERHRKLNDYFPLCELHEVRIVGEFPKGCPMRHANPLVAIENMQDAAHKADVADGNRGLALLVMREVCGSCLDRLLSNATVKRLRGGT